MEIKTRTIRLFWNDKFEMDYISGHIAGMMHALSEHEPNCGRRSEYCVLQGEILYKDHRADMTDKNWQKAKEIILANRLYSKLCVFVED